MESIDVAAVITQIDLVLESTKDADPSTRATRLSAAIEPVRCLEGFSRVPLARMSHARDPDYDPRHDAQVVRDAIVIRQHLRARGVHVTVMHCEVPKRQFEPNFVADPEEARIDAAILSSLKQYLE